MIRQSIATLPVGLPEITLTIPLPVGNPIHTYNVVKRLAVDFVSLEKEISFDDWKGRVRPKTYKRDTCLIHNATFAWENIMEISLFYIKILWRYPCFISKYWLFLISVVLYENEFQGRNMTECISFYPFIVHFYCIR